MTPPTPNPAPAPPDVKLVEAVDAALQARQTMDLSILLSAIDRLREAREAMRPQPTSPWRAMAERMVELVRRDNGHWSMRLSGQSDLLWHSGDYRLMQQRGREMVNSLTAAFEKVAAEQEVKTLGRLAELEKGEGR